MMTRGLRLGVPRQNDGDFSRVVKNGRAQVKDQRLEQVDIVYI